MTGNGRGWHGDSEGHAKAGSKSSGNKYAAKNLSTQDRSKGGSMSSGNFKNDPERARRAGKKGGSK
jgi:general stress protein YciG